MLLVILKAKKWLEFFTKINCKKIIIVKIIKRKGGKLYVKRKGGDGSVNNGIDNKDTV